MQNSMEWKRKYFSPETQAKAAERRRNWSVELQGKPARTGQTFGGQSQLAGGSEETVARKARTAGVHRQGVTRRGKVTRASVGAQHGCAPA